MQLLKTAVTYNDSQKVKGSEKFEKLPTNRLITMLQQAVAYQIEFGAYHPRLRPKITSLFEDYSCFVVPNALQLTYSGHTDSVKCVDFVGEAGLSIVSGGSDATVRLWDTESGTCSAVLSGHSGRIWDVCSSLRGRFVASASADTQVKLWDLQQLNNGEETKDDSLNATTTPVATLSGQSADVYAVKFDGTGVSVEDEYGMYKYVCTHRQCIVWTAKDSDRWL